MKSRCLFVLFLVGSLFSLFLLGCGLISDLQESGATFVSVTTQLQQAELVDSEAIPSSLLENSFSSLSYLKFAESESETCLTLCIVTVETIFGFFTGSEEQAFFCQTFLDGQATIEDLETGVPFVYGLFSGPCTSSTSYFKSEDSSETGISLIQYGATEIEFPAGGDLICSLGIIDSQLTYECSDEEGDAVEFGTYGETDTTGTCEELFADLFEDGLSGVWSIIEFEPISGGMVKPKQPAKKPQNGAKLQQDDGNAVGSDDMNLENETVTIVQTGDEIAIRPPKSGKFIKGPAVCRRLELADGTIGMNIEARLTDYNGIGPDCKMHETTVFNGKYNNTDKTIDAYLHTITQLEGECKKAGTVDMGNKVGSEESPKLFKKSESGKSIMEQEAKVTLQKSELLSEEFTLESATEIPDTAKIESTIPFNLYQMNVGEGCTDADIDDFLSFFVPTNDIESLNAGEIVSIEALWELAEGTLTVKFGMKESSISSFGEGFNEGVVDGDNVGLFSEAYYTFDENSGDRKVEFNSGFHWTNSSGNCDMGLAFHSGPQYYELGGGDLLEYADSYYAEFSIVTADKKGIFYDTSCTSFVKEAYNGTISMEDAGNNVANFAFTLKDSSGTSLISNTSSDPTSTTDEYNYSLQFYPDPETGFLAAAVDVKLNHDGCYGGINLHYEQKGKEELNEADIDNFLKTFKDVKKTFKISSTSTVSEQASASTTCYPDEIEQFKKVFGVDSPDLIAQKDYTIYVQNFKLDKDGVTGPAANAEFSNSSGVKLWQLKDIPYFIAPNGEFSMYFGDTLSESNLWTSLSVFGVIEIIGETKVAKFTGLDLYVDAGNTCFFSYKFSEQSI